MSSQAQSLNLAIDLRVLGFTAGVSLLTAMLFGLIPALARAASIHRRCCEAGISPMAAGCARASDGCSSQDRSPPRYSCSSAPDCSQTLIKLRDINLGLTRDTILATRVESRGSNQKGPNFNRLRARIRRSPHARARAARRARRQPRERHAARREQNAARRRRHGGQHGAATHRAAAATPPHPRSAERPRGCDGRRSIRNISRHLASRCSRAANSRPPTTIARMPSHRGDQRDDGETACSARQRRRSDGRSTVRRRRRARWRP